MSEEFSTNQSPCVTSIAKEVKKVEPVERNVTRIEVSTNLIVFFDEDDEVYRLNLDFFPDFDKGQALNINIKAKMMI